jgi:hypothetical protein
MKSWVDTTVANKDTWLVLVFHGIDSLGWEWTPIPKLEEYFKYIKEREDRVWIATFGDVTKYIREREHATVNAKNTKNGIEITLTHTLDKPMYDLPLTIKTYIPQDWKKATVTQGTTKQSPAIQHDDKGSYVLCQLKPNSATAQITP